MPVARQSSHARAFVLILHLLLFWFVVFFRRVFLQWCAVRKLVRTEMTVFLGAHQTIFDGYGYISYA